MSNILIAWEEGSHAGHFSRMTWISARLKEAGQNCIITIPENQLSNPWLVNSDCEKMQSPEPQIKPITFIPTPVLSCASIMVMFGFSDKEYILQSVKLWIELFKEKDIYSVVIDYAPVAQLAAYIVGLNCVELSDGFYDPSKDDVLSTSEKMTPEQKQANDKVIKHITSVINYVIKTITDQSELNYTGYLNHTAKYYDNIPELDSYASCTPSNTIGPVSGLIVKNDIEWKESNSKLKVFVYLRKENYYSNDVIRYLTDKGISSVCVYPDMNAEDAVKYSVGSMVVTSTATDVVSKIKECTHVICYGSIFAVATAAITGKPNLIIAGDTQKKSIGKLASEVTGALLIQENNTCIDLVLDMFLSSKYLLDRSTSFAKKYEHNDFSIIRKMFISKIINKQKEHKLWKSTTSQPYLDQTHRSC